MRVLVTPDYRTLSEEAAALVARAVRAKPDITLGLPTGSTPLGMYEELIRKHRHEELDFSRVRTFNLDEYLGLAPDDP
ncbi:MAG TPA: glucosamine-6-phosphate deaminase, partial [Terriglobia bacterium]|nr:glucosamine-6-phosphate deaminase [Terriglobia bacterium]